MTDRHAERKKIEAQIAAFLKAGGRIKKIAPSERGAKDLTGRDIFKRAVERDSGLIPDRKAGSASDE